MKKFIFALLFCTVLCVAGAGYLFIQSLNSESYKKQIIASVQNMTGRQLSINGKTSLKLFPIPTLVLEDITLDNHQNSEQKYMLTAGSLRAQIDWQSLMKTPLEIKDIELINPTLFLERLESNRVNWNLPFLSAPDADISDSQMFVSNTVQTDTKISAVKLKSGTIVYSNQVTKKTVTLNDINGNFTADSLKGPYKFNLGINWKNVKYGVSGDLDKLKNDQPAKVKLAITEASSGLAADFNGEVTMNDPTRILEGSASFGLDHPTKILSYFDIPVISSDFDNTAVGSFSIKTSALKDTIENLTIRFGDNDTALAATGSLTYETKTATSDEKYSGQIAFNSINGDNFKPMFALFDWDKLPTEETALPQTEIKLMMPEIKTANGVITDTEGQIETKGHTVKISQAKSTLNGNAINFIAENGVRKEVPYISAHIKTAQGKSVNLDKMAELFDIKLPFKPETVADAAFDIEMALVKGRYGIKLKSAQLGDAIIAGGIQITPQANQIKADLSLNHINIDKYLDWDQSAEAVSVSSIYEVLSDTIKKAQVPTQSNWTLNLKGKDITWRNLPIQSGELQATLKNRLLQIQKIQMNNVLGTSLLATGKAAGVGTENASIQGLTLDLTTEKLPTFMQAVKVKSDWDLFNTADEATLSAEFTKKDGLYDTKITTKLNGLSAKMDGNISLASNRLGFKNFGYTVLHPNFQKFLKLINQDTTLLANLPGAFRAQGNLSGTDKKMVIDGIDTSVGTQKITGKIIFENDGTKKLTINLSSPAIEGERFIPNLNFVYTQNGLSDTPLPLDKLKDWDITFNMGINKLTYKAMTLNNVYTDWTLKDKVITLNKFSSAGENQETSKADISGVLSFITQPTLKLNFSLDDIPLRSDFMIVNKFSFGDGIASLNGNVNATGNSAAQMVQNLNGSGKLSLKGNQFIGVDFAKVPPLIQKALSRELTQEEFNVQTNRALNLGKTTADNFEGSYSIAQGIIRFMDMTLKTAVATASPAQITTDLSTDSTEISMPVLFNDYQTFPPVLINVIMNPKGKSYTPDFSELSEAVFGIVSRDIKQLQAQEERAAELQRKQALEQQAQNMQNLIENARRSVEEASGAIAKSTNEQAEIILQNAKDALSMMEQLIALPERTEAQEQMLFEKAQQAIQKSNDAMAELQRTADYVTQIKAFYAQAEAMVEKMQEYQKNMPDVILIPRLLAQSLQDKNTIQNALNDATGETEMMQKVAYVKAEQALKSIQANYENVMRFDASVVQSAQGDNTASVRGSINRK